MATLRRQTQHGTPCKAKNEPAARVARARSEHSEPTPRGHWHVTREHAEPPRQSERAVQLLRLLVVDSPALRAATGLVSVQAQVMSSWHLCSCPQQQGAE